MYNTSLCLSDFLHVLQIHSSNKSVQYFAVSNPSIVQPYLTLFDIVVITKYQEIMYESRPESLSRSTKTLRPCSQYYNYKLISRNYYT